jgi:hypothetical protein
MYGDSPDTLSVSRGHSSAARQFHHNQILAVANPSAIHFEVTHTRRAIRFVSKFVTASAREDREVLAATGS